MSTKKLQILGCSFGQAGKDGVSCTHSWDGTILTVTSASGTSSVDLKGEKGDTGADGSAYILTEDDKAEIISNVKADLTPLEPGFANDISECVDKSKAYVLPDGYVYSYRKVEKIENGSILSALDPLVGLQKKDTGLYYGYYATSEGNGYAMDSNCMITGIVPCTVDNCPLTIYIKGVYSWGDSSHDRVALTCNGKVAALKSLKATDSSTYFTVTKISDGYYSVEIQAEYFNSVSSKVVDGVVLSIDNTVKDQEIAVSLSPIKETTVITYDWKNTGHAFITSENVTGDVLVNSNIMFVNSLDDCTDRNNVYVLPDGYVYGYTIKTATTNPTNQLPLSINADGTPYNNGQGWVAGYKLNAGTGAEGTYTNYEVSGFIPVTANDTFRIGGYRMDSNATAYDNICFYDSNFDIVGAFTNKSSYNPLSQFVKDDGSLEACISTATTTNFSEDKKSSISYMRLSLYNISSATIVTVNEPLESTTQTTAIWSNTGHAFIPADYEDRIIELEESFEALSTGSSVGVDGYVLIEADRVAKEVLSHQNANTFTFMVLSDAHYLSGDEKIEASITHTGQGMDLVRKGVHVDFAVNLGDSGWGSGVANSANRATLEVGKEEIRSTNKCIDNAFRGLPNFRAVGNHDSLIYNYTFNDDKYLDNNALYPLIGAYNTGATYPATERDRGYCYRDFEDYKLRVICLNTSDIKDLEKSDSTRPIYVSGTQAQWFAESLDLSSKDNAGEWSILILSHCPLDWGSAVIYLCDILQAYLDGTTVSIERDGVTIAYDYANKNNATIIGNCHGHNHCFLVDNLRRLVSDTTTEAINIKRFCVPNACFERSNERGENDTVDVYDIEYGDETTYDKVQNTAEDTAFNVITIDPVARKIYATNYGAGIDREFDY